MDIKEQMVNDYTLSVIDSITMLFWNHTDTDINYLRKSSSNIDHVWITYIDSTGDTYTALWKAWIDKFTDDSKQIIADYATKKFGSIEGSMIDEYQFE